MNKILNNLKTPIEKPIVFFHIPKTAGTNFTYVIENNYKNTHKRVGFKYVDKKDGSLACAFGHHAFEDTYNNDCIMFLFLRDPVERVISHFVEHKNNQYMDKGITMEEIFQTRADEYMGAEYPSEALAKRAGFHGNAPWASEFYCRCLTAKGFRGNTPYPVPSSVADDIIENIGNNTLFYNGKHVPCVFGITERFSESIDMFAKIAGWQTTGYVEKSKGRAYNKGKRKYNASEELVKQISLRNPLDARIYKAACKQFDQQLDFFNDKEV